MSLRGSVLIHDTDQCNQEEFQIPLRMMRSVWRGWNIVLFLDRASSHKAEEAIFFAEHLGIALRWLPVACPAESHGSPLAPYQRRCIGEYALPLFGRGHCPGASVPARHRSGWLDAQSWAVF